MKAVKKQFKKHVESALGLAAYQQGIQALKSTDRKRLTVSIAAKLLGSADIDTALKKKEPNAARWDYLVGLAKTQSTARLIFLEVHPARSGTNIREMETKAKWLLGWTSRSLFDRYSKRVIWVASGKCSFTPRSPQLKNLALLGCEMVGEHFTL